MSKKDPKFADKWSQLQKIENLKDYLNVVFINHNQTINQENK